MHMKPNKIKEMLKKISPLVWIISVVAVVAVIWLGSIAFDAFGWGFGGKEQIVVKIPEGCTVARMADILKEEDIIGHPLVFRLYEKMDGKEHTFQQGGHILTKNMSYGAIIEKLTHMPEYGPNEIVSVLIPEGYEARQIAETLAEKGLVDKEKFLKELEEGQFDFEFIKDIDRRENRLEGYLFPATYEIAVGESEHDIICRMLQAFQDNILPVYNQAQTDYTLDQVVTFASLVEREAANDGERPIVASVFYNRMEKDMTLSSCASVQYILKERKPILSNSDIKIKSDYNTYINKGLPVGPIASPGVSSVKAVLEPADTDYLYFAARMDGSENVFSRTGEEHMKTVQELQGN